MLISHKKNFTAKDFHIEKLLISSVQKIKKLHVTSL